MLHNESGAASAGEPGAETRIVDTALGELEALRLIRRISDAVHLARPSRGTRLGEPTVTGIPEPAGSTLA